MNNSKRIISLLLVCALLLGVLAACGTTSTPPSSDPSVSETPNNSSSPAPEVPATPAKIAVAFSSMGASELLQKEYLENYIGPAFNVEFMFSEALNDIGAVVTFIEQARAAGCQGLMNFHADAIEQASAIANDAGMYIVSNNNYIPDSVKDMPYNIGSIGTSVASTAETYGELVKAVVSDGKPHNIVIVSGGSAQGNNQHRETTIAILQILQDTYGLTYDADLKTLATSNTQTFVETGTDMKIAIYPGYAGADTYVTGFSSLLQSGDYDVVLSTYAVYPKLMQPISEVESAFGFDVQLVSIANIDDGAKSAFESGALNSAILSPGCMGVGAMFVLLYNAIQGNVEALRDDGHAAQYQLLKWTCAGKPEYTTVEQLDIQAGTYAISIDDVNSLLVSKDASVNYEVINEFFGNLTAQNVAAKSGF